MIIFTVGIFLNIYIYERALNIMKKKNRESIGD